MECLYLRRLTIVGLTVTTMARYGSGISPWPDDDLAAGAATTSMNTATLHRWRLTANTVTSRCGSLDSAPRHQWRAPVTTNGAIRIAHLTVAGTDLAAGAGNTPLNMPTISAR